MRGQQKPAAGKGFTIIEVVLVLAIAGLIFLVIFLALPMLQRNQRDTARKSSLGQIVGQIENFRSNNRGVELCSEPTPAVCGNQAASGTTSYSSFIASYLKPEHRAPDNLPAVTDSFYAYTTGQATSFSSTAFAGAIYPPGMIVLSNGGYCSGGRLVYDVLDKRDGIAAWIKTEIGEGYCQET